MWHSVCNDIILDNDADARNAFANLACTELGYPPDNGHQVWSAYAAPAPTPILTMDRASTGLAKGVACTGNEDSIFECAMNFGRDTGSACSHSEDVGLGCNGEWCCAYGSMNKGESVKNAHCCLSLFVAFRFPRPPTPTYSLLHSVALQQKVS